MGVLDILPHTANSYAILILAIALTYHAAYICYNLFLHPLAKFPGPRLAASTNLWYGVNWTSGRWPYVMRELHAKYGDVVRVAPNELSFCSAESYNDIYGYPGKGRQPFLKAPNYDHGPNAHIVGARDPEDHRRQRKALSHAFSSKALRDQEDIVVEYVDLFIAQLERLGTSKDGINISEALAWVTFDIIGELTFGESFDAVKTGTTHPWVSAIVDNVREFDLFQLRRDIPVVALLLPFLVPITKLKRQYDIHQQLTVEKTAKRIDNKNKISREDFFKHIIEKGEFTRECLEANADVLIIAGSETTATALAGMMYYLSQNQACLSILQQEVRSAFNSNNQITGDSTATLPYLNAVIEEGLRIYPPVAFGLKRVSPGATVGGHYVPAGAYVSTDPWATMHRSQYWRHPDAFVPDRWLGNAFGDNKGAFKPFSLGPRGCLGINLAYMEMRIILAKMVWANDWEMLSDVDWVRENNAYPLWKKPEMRMRFFQRVGISAN